MKKTPADLAQEISRILHGHPLSVAAGAIARVLVGMMAQVPLEHKHRVMQSVVDETQKLTEAMKKRM
jgi:hypothetical protein